MIFVIACLLLLSLINVHASPPPSSSSSSSATTKRYSAKARSLSPQEWLDKFHLTIEHDGAFLPNRSTYDRILLESLDIARGMVASLDNEIHVISKDVSVFSDLFPRPNDEYLQAPVYQNFGEIVQGNFDPDSAVRYLQVEMTNLINAETLDAVFGKAAMVRPFWRWLVVVIETLLHHPKRSMYVYQIISELVHIIEALRCAALLKKTGSASSSMDATGFVEYTKAPLFQWYERLADHPNPDALKENYAIWLMRHSLSDMTRRQRTVAERLMRSGKVPPELVELSEESFSMIKRSAKLFIELKNVSRLIQEKNNVTSTIFEIFDSIPVTDFDEVEHRIRPSVGILRSYLRSIREATTFTGYSDTEFEEIIPLLNLYTTLLPTVSSNHRFLSSLQEWRSEVRKSIDSYLRRYRTTRPIQRTNRRAQRAIEHNAAVYSELSMHVARIFSTDRHFGSHLYFIYATKVTTEDKYYDNLSKRMKDFMRLPVSIVNRAFHNKAYEIMQAVFRQWLHVYGEYEEDILSRWRLADVFVPDERTEEEALDDDDRSNEEETEVEEFNDQEASLNDYEESIRNALYNGQSDVNDDEPLYDSSEDDSKPYEEDAEPSLSSETEGKACSMVESAASSGRFISTTILPLTLDVSDMRILCQLQGKTRGAASLPWRSIYGLLKRAGAEIVPMGGSKLNVRISRPANVSGNVSGFYPVRIDRPHTFNKIGRKFALMLGKMMREVWHIDSELFSYENKHEG